VRINGKLIAEWREGIDTFASANKTNLKEVFSIVYVKTCRLRKVLQNITK
jgi:hypothetical protein